MTNWKEYKLSDLMQIKYGKDHKHLADGSYPLYGSGGIMRFVEKPLYDDESILIPRKGTLSNLFYLNVPFWSVDTMFWSIINRDLALPKYLYYTLKTFDLASLNVGSAVPSLTTQVLNELLVSVPSLPTQTVIAEILSSLDDKIELNNKINQELENLAQTLFKQWFIDFEFPNVNGDPYKSSGGEMIDSELGEIPKEWEVGKYGEFTKTTSGGTPSRKKDEYYINGSILWVKSKELNNSMFFDTEEKINELALKNSSAKLLPPYSVLVAMYGATVGKFGLITTEAACNQAICAVLPSQKLPYSFNYLFFQNYRKELENFAVGSAQQNISQEFIKSVKIALPQNNLLETFHRLVEPFLNAIENNCRENQELTNLRDTLLPKLISGELNLKV
jgi:type I restriction enzyme S subunit